MELHPDLYGEFAREWMADRAGEIRHGRATFRPRGRRPLAGHRGDRGTAPAGPDR